MIDVQSSLETRDLSLPDVGISGFRHRVVTGDRRDQGAVVALLELGVALPAHQKGTHMSRLVQLVMEHEADLTLEALPVVAKRLLASLEASSGRISVDFPFVVQQDSPVTGLKAQNVHDARLSAALNDDVLELRAEVRVVATSVCPCSKAISDYGAHNQRSRISVAVAMTGESAPTRVPLLRDLVRSAEQASSCATYPLLKRPDERQVTMRAYEHPAFVEDIARDVALKLIPLRGPGSYQVLVVNEESIHRHDAYASVHGAVEEDPIGFSAGP